MKRIRVATMVAATGGMPMKVHEVVRILIVIASSQKADKQSRIELKKSRGQFQRGLRLISEIGVKIP